MSLKNRLKRLERTSPAPDYTGAREELLRRRERADPETGARVLRAIKGEQKRDA